ncbi:hypothetical protein [Streptomyces parvus]|uniref:hypothetical protein n=1 Tax=Streptomyces parvus TaxID=66428 RepID=UPI003631EFD1
MRSPVVRRPSAVRRLVPQGRGFDPQQTGDAFRAGFLTGLGWGRGPVAAARLGCALAAASPAGVGPQDHEVRPRTLLTSLARAYDRPAAQEFSPACASWTPRRTARPHRTAPAARPYEARGAGRPGPGSGAERAKARPGQW